MANGAELYISCELDANTLKIAAYRHNMFVGWLTGYKNHRNKTVKIFPRSNICRGVFGNGDFPVECSLFDLPWLRKN